MKFTGFLCFLLPITLINCEILKLRDGVINGTTGKSRNGRKFQTFYGIPYAEPPVGELRFKVPKPAKPWSDTKNTTEPPPMCVQPALNDNTSTSYFTGQEDCLYLNVHTPMDTAKESAKAPVIVYIHGGGFNFGDGAGNKPDYFMERDVVFVTINYRLGVLGFLSMNNDHISGNFGMKDQVLALQWIKDNIAAFGGDPDSITLMGESAGAGSVHLHMFSPLSQGLFYKAIMQSGNALATVSCNEDFYAEAKAATFIVSAGCLFRDPAKILKCLQRISVNDIFSITTTLKAGIIKPWPIWYSPSVESKVLDRPFLSQKPTKNYISKVPWLTGINSGEGAMMIREYYKNDGQLFNIANKNRTLLFPEFLGYQMTAKSEDMDNITAKISHFYFDNADLSLRNALNITRMHADIIFLHPLIKSLQTYHLPRYVYLYDHRGSYSIQDKLVNVTTYLGASHADEIPLLFRDEKLEAKRTPQDESVSKILLNNWINFATYSDPNGLSKDKIWKPVETYGIEYLHIKSDSVTMEEDLMKERYQFWDSLPLGQGFS